MTKTYQPGLYEEKLYQIWEKSGAFTPKVPANPKKAKTLKKPFSIILPPPNANNPLHAGHALYTVEDIMVRYHRMLGDPTLWLPGTDHAGIETQFVFEKHLQKQGKSRFDYDRQTLFKLIFDYVQENRDVAKNQMKRLGFSLDWTREKFTMDEDHVSRVYVIFRRMVKEGLVYRDEKIVNYCTFCGTAFSNLEVEHKTLDSHLWYFNYPLSNDPTRFITVATTRPETMLGDTAVAVSPKDKRYQDLIGHYLTLPLVGRQIPIIAEDSVDPEFGTGVVKVTPAHSPEDYDMGKKHQLEFIRIFDYDGQANDSVPEKYRGLFPKQVREAVLNDLQDQGFLVKTENYAHEVGHCYKCGRPIEPITAPQWFVKIDSLAKAATKAVKDDKVKIFPARFKKNFLTWMKDIKDWPISRQIVWGHQIPIWYCLDNDPSKFDLTFIDKNSQIVHGNWSQLSDKGYTHQEVEPGLQSLIAQTDTKFYLSQEEAQKEGDFVLQETDTFDTWFSSGQWPYSTLGFNPDDPQKSSPDFGYFYPTTVLDTMWDILFFWVARMIMMGLYATGEVPFEVAHMHSRVVDAKGQKMSKSKGNAIDPLTVSDTYGADALRMALVIGVAPGSDIALSEDKIRAQRNFVNKIWNASRFVEMIIDRFQETDSSFKPSLTINPKTLTKEDQKILKALDKLITSTTNKIDNYRFGQASEELYHFFWHNFCDIYIESTKGRDTSAIPVLLYVLITSLKLLHPFIPFVTESVYQHFNQKYSLNPQEALLISAHWPQS